MMVACSASPGSARSDRNYASFTDRERRSSPLTGVGFNFRHAGGLHHPNDFMLTSCGVEC